MALAQTLLPEFQQEMATTRRLLERLPESKFDWKPHDRSMTLGELATHLTQIPVWLNLIVERDSFDMRPAGAPPPKAAPLHSTAAVLARFDETVKSAHERLAAARDTDLVRPWSLLQTGKEFFTLPKIACIRSFVFSHSIHHRGQLSVYLRMHDVPLPPIYGPTADEGV